MQRPRRLRTSALASVMAAAAALVALSLSAPASSQPAAATAPRRPAGKARDDGSFRGSMGVAVAERLLASDDAAERLRGVERLGAIGTPEAIDALLSALEQGSAAGRDAKARLVAVRALSDHAARDSVRQFLVRELSDTAGAEGRGAASPLSALTRSTAAIALARAASGPAGRGGEPRGAGKDKGKGTDAGAGTGAGTGAGMDAGTGAGTDAARGSTSRGGAANEEKKALGPLVSAVLQGGAAAEAASRALTAYPPVSLAPFLEGKKRLSPQLATFLGDLGDLRAIERLRAMLAEPDQAGKAAAAVALARLGDEAALAPARAWIGRTDPRLQKAAAEVLTHLGAPEAPQAIATLLGSDALRLEGVRLASLSPSAALAKALAAAVLALPEEERARGVAALGRAGGTEAVKQLSALLTRPELATDAAYALAIMPESAAREAIESALAKAPSSPAAGSAPSPGGAGAPAGAALERALLRAGIVRAVMLRDAPGSLESKLEARVSSKDPTDRAIAVFGLVATGARDVDAILEDLCPAAAAAASEGVWRGASAAGSPAGASGKAAAPLACDEIAVRAAARGALSRGPEARRPFMALLQAFGRAAFVASASAGKPSPGASGSPPFEPETAIAAGVALLAHPDGGDLPTSVLASWAEAGGPLAALAARALPSRDDEVLRGRLKRLLEGSDPVVRAHVALGLGRDPEPDAVSLLTSAYRFEEDASVRRAIVRALSRRAEVQREKTLTLARDLDPDAGVRALARSALEGRALDDPRPSSAGGGAVSGLAVWITLSPNDPAALKAAESRAARVVRADGIAVPVVADPDGVLLVLGLPPGPVSMFLGRPAPFSAR